MIRSAILLSLAMFFSPGLYAAISGTWEGKAHIQNEKGGFYCDLSFVMEDAEKTFTLGARTFVCKEETFVYPAIVFTKDEQGNLYLGETEQGKISASPTETSIDIRFASNILKGLIMAQYDAESDELHFGEFVSDEGINRSIHIRKPLLRQN